MSGRTFKVNKTNWKIRFVEPHSEFLKRTNGEYALGVTDKNLKSVFLANNLSEVMTRKVICHELCHVICMSYNIYMTIDEEEQLADWIATYGTELMYLLDDLMYRVKTKRTYVA